MRIVLFLGLWSLWFSIGLAEQTSQTELIYSTDEIFRRLVKQNNLVKSFFVEYQAVGTFPVYNHRKLGVLWPDHCYYMGAKGRKRLNWSAEYVDKEWENDLFQDWVLVTSDMCYSALSRQRVFLQYGLTSHDKLPEKLQSEILFIVLGWWPFEHRPTPCSHLFHSCVIPDIVVSNDYILRSHLETIENKACHVLEGKNNVIWIFLDDVNCMVMKKEFYDPDTGAIVQRLQMTNHQQKQGVFYPQKVRSTIFNNDSLFENRRNEIISDANLLLLNVLLNDEVDKNIFTLKTPMPASIMITDAVNDSYTQHVPGGHEFMDEISIQAINFSNFKRLQTNTYYINNVFYLLCIFLSLCTIYWTYKRILQKFR